MEVVKIDFSISDQIKSMLKPEVLKRVNELPRFEIGPEPEGLAEREFGGWIDFPNSHKYYGEVKKGSELREGKGISIFNNGDIY